MALTPSSAANTVELKETYNIPFNQRVRVPIESDPQYNDHGSCLEWCPTEPPNHSGQLNQ